MGRVMLGETVGLRWTGHALVDVGIAGLCAFAERERPEELTFEDLDKAGELMVKEYYGEKFKTFLHCVFPNATFVQKRVEELTKEAFNRRYFRAHRASPDPVVIGQHCIFSGEPATSWLVRTHLPLFSAERVVNFRPDGTASVPVAGPFVVALMFLPLASRRAEGKLLAVHADDPALTLRFAHLYLKDNRRLLAMPLPTEPAAFHPEFEREQPVRDSGKSGHYKFADVKAPRSFIIADLTELARLTLPTTRRCHPTGLTVYHLSNSGQGTSLDIFDIPSGLVNFIARASGARTRTAWQSIQRNFDPFNNKRDDGGSKSRSKSPLIEGRPGITRNQAFEELSAIFEPGFTDKRAAAAWLSKHVLGRLNRGSRTTFTHTQARTWALAGLFLEEVMGMKPGQVEAIRVFADKVAGWIHEKYDKRLFHALMFGKLPDAQQGLRKTQRKSAINGGPVLFGLDEFTNVWLHSHDSIYLTRDLICIRIAEKLDELGYFREHPEDQFDADDIDTETEHEERSSL